MGVICNLPKVTHLAGSAEVQNITSRESILLLTTDINTRQMMVLSLYPEVKTKLQLPLCNTASKIQNSPPPTQTPSIRLQLLCCDELQRGFVMERPHLPVLKIWNKVQMLAMVPEGAGEVSGCMSLQLLEVPGVCGSANTIFTAACVLISKFRLFIKTWVTFVNT